jgi:hypothetical protein
VGDVIRPRPYLDLRTVKEPVVTPQSREVLKALKGGLALTALVALRRFGIFRLAARIHDLKALGHAIVTRRVERKGKWVAEYRLQNDRRHP